VVGDVLSKKRLASVNALRWQLGCGLQHFLAEPCNQQPASDHSARVVGEVEGQRTRAQGSAPSGLLRHWQKPHALAPDFLAQFVEAFFSSERLNRLCDESLFQS
jgi:hypothetical protein